MKNHALVVISISGFQLCRDTWSPAPSAFHLPPLTAQSGPSRLTQSLFAVSRPVISTASLKESALYHPSLHHCPALIHPSSPSEVYMSIQAYVYVMSECTHTLTQKILGSLWVMNLVKY